MLPTGTHTKAVGVGIEMLGFFEAHTFDSCNGHSSPSGPPPGGAYMDRMGKQSQMIGRRA
jgi:hypothetical protein